VATLTGTPKLAPPSVDLAMKMDWLPVSGQKANT
jgi:hypothetical protein